MAVDPGYSTGWASGKRDRLKMPPFTTSSDRRSTTSTTARKPRCRCAATSVAIACMACSVRSRWTARARVRCPSCHRICSITAGSQRRVSRRVPQPATTVNVGPFQRRVSRKVQTSMPASTHARSTAPVRGSPDAMRMCSNGVSGSSTNSRRRRQMLSSSSGASPQHTRSSSEAESAPCSTVLWMASIVDDSHPERVKR